LHERSPLYRDLGDAVVETGGKSPEDLVEAILACWTMSRDGTMATPKSSPPRSGRTHVPHMAHPGNARTGDLLDRDSRGQLLECLHLPAALAEECDLAQLAMPPLLVGDRGAR